MTRPCTLTLNQASFSYDNVPVLQQCSAELNGGQLVGLIGPNGAGKSTLLRLLAGMSKVEQGHLELNGTPLHKLSTMERARQITLVPQDCQINFAFSAREVVAMGRNPWLGRFQPPGLDDLALIDQAMSRTDVLHLADRPVNTLSGGERQRVVIARAIAQQTPIILLDEATANLDIAHQLTLLGLARSLSEQGQLVIAAIHDLNMAARFCDRLLLLAEQTLQADGTAEMVLTCDNLSRYFQLDAEIIPASNERALTLYPRAPVSALTNNATTQSVAQ
ncbi:MAG: ABC transporter ATP-binding protein [Marinobacterium sp.]|nr:ABC transporter ATP-binding protein [Marinobacterium sp.]